MRTYSKEELQDNVRYLELLSKSFPTANKAVEEIVNLSAILNLPKGTEHFLTDIHGEDEAFHHVMQNASGAIRRKVLEELENTVCITELNELVTLIYYPKEKLDLIKKEKTGDILENWYKLTIYRLVIVCRAAASKYTRSKVRKALPEDFAYIMEELIQEEEERMNKKEYYHNIIDSLVFYGRADTFIIKISQVIKRFVIDHLHIIGDIFDRGPGPHHVMETLMDHHSLDIQWGNHDILWMGAAAGSLACICNVIRIALRYANINVLEDGYGINMINLAGLAENYYTDDPCDAFLPKVNPESMSSYEYGLMARMHKAISVIQFKIEDQLIKSHPEYMMEDRIILSTFNAEKGTVMVEGVEYPLNDTLFPTVDPKNPAQLTEVEQNVVDKLLISFKASDKLQKHVRFLFNKGSMYLAYNNNLLYHASMPITEEGTFKVIKLEDEYYSGKRLMDKMDQMAREAYFSQKELRQTDFFWYLWCHQDSPLFGKSKMATFERYFIDDKKTHKEHYTPYFIKMDDDGTFAKMLLKEFGVDPEVGRIINGHVPVKVKSGESPIRAGGKLLVIDGGFAKAYQKSTGIAGYTLTYNSYGLTLMVHQPFESLERVLSDEYDMMSMKNVVETVVKRIRVRDTDIGKKLMKQKEELEMLIQGYRKGIIKEKLS